MRQIPTIDLAPTLRGEPGARAEAAAQLAAAYEQVGFCRLVEHGVDPDVTAAAFAASERVHGLSEADKAAIAINEHHRGFIAMATSTIVTSTVDKVTRPNQSESLILGQELAPDHPDIVAGIPLAGPNRWPVAAPEVREPILAYQRAMQDLSTAVSEIVAVALGQDPQYFAPHIAEPTTFLRLLRYPPKPAGAPADLYGSAPHSDYGFFTLLAQRGEAGLQVRYPDGEWIEVAPDTDGLVMNAGDILHRWSNGRFRSTPHRVINDSGGERFSIAYFFDPHFSCDVEPLAACIDEGTDPRFERVNYGDYIWSRLRKNYSQHQTA